MFSLPNKRWQTAAGIVLILVGGSIMAEEDGGNEEAPDFDITEKTRWIEPRIYIGSREETPGALISAREHAEIMEELNRPRQPLRIENGVDAEYVKYMQQIDQSWTTDKEGRIIGVFIRCSCADPSTNEPATLPMDEILERLAPLHHVRAVRLSEDFDDKPTKPLTDEGFQVLAGWTKLEHVRIETNSLTGRAFSQLAKVNPLARLQYLDIYVISEADEVAAVIGNCKELRYISWNVGRDRSIDLTDEGLKHFAKLKQLQNFSLQKSQISGEGMQYLARLDNLRELSLEDSIIGDEGLRHLSQMVQLEALYIGDPNITDVGLADLAKLKNLQQLSLTKSTISAAGLEQLVDLKRLVGLQLPETPLGDEALPVLKQMQQLEFLNITDTQFSKKGLKQLKLDLPECNIWE